MISRWLPFVCGILIEYIISIAVYFSLITLRTQQMSSSLNLEHCSTTGLNQFGQSVELCAQSAVIQFLNKPSFLVTLLLTFIIFGFIFGYFISLWGLKKNSAFIFLVGAFSAYFLLSSIDRSYIAAAGLFIGHLLGWFIAKYRFKQ